MMLSPVASKTPRSDIAEVSGDDRGANIRTDPDVVVLGDVYTATPTDPQIFKAAASACDINSYSP